MSKSFNDGVFGKLKWQKDGVSLGGGAWEGFFECKFFRDFGQKLLAVDSNDSEEYLILSGGKGFPGSDDPFQNSIVDHATKLPLVISTKSKIPVAPREHQRHAWRLLLEQGDTLWTSLMDMLLKEYKRHHGFRRKWVRQCCGATIAEKNLTNVRSAHELRELLRPKMLHVLHDDKDEIPSILIAFSSTYGIEAARIDRGICVELGGANLLRHYEQVELIDSPVLGSLSRSNRQSPWRGVIHVPPFRAFRNIEKDRMAFNQDGEEVLPWDFVHGVFDLRIMVKPGGLPELKQRQAASRFLSRISSESRNIVKILLTDLQRSMKASVLSGKKGAYGPPELNERLELECVTIARPTSKGSVNVVLSFSSDWSRQLEMCWNKHEWRIIHK